MARGRLQAGHFVCFESGGVQGEEYRCRGHLCLPHHSHGGHHLGRSNDGRNAEKIHEPFCAMIMDETEGTKMIKRAAKKRRRSKVVTEMEGDPPFFCASPGGDWYYVLVTIQGRMPFRRHRMSRRARLGRRARGSYSSHRRPLRRIRRGDNCGWCGRGGWGC